MQLVNDMRWGAANQLPKRFTLMPTGSASMQVLIASDCIGHVWNEDDRWLACDISGQLLDTGSSQTVLEAVTILFATTTDDLSN